MLNKYISPLLAAISLASTCHATTIKTVWEPLKGQFSTYEIKDKKNVKPFFSVHKFKNKSDYKLSLLKETTTDLENHSAIKHYRYQQYYKNIPIFAKQVIFHYYPNKKTLVTGYVIKGIEKDIKSINAKIDKDSIAHIALKNINPNTIIGEKLINKVIYIKDDKAFLAYHISLFNKNDGIVHDTNIIMDANTASTLKKWDDLNRVHMPNKHHGKTQQSSLHSSTPSPNTKPWYSPLLIKLGQGPGGTTNARSPIGTWNYRVNPSGRNVFGPLQVQRIAGQCNMRTRFVQIKNMLNADSSLLNIPVSSNNETRLPYNDEFAYACGGTNTNATDEGTAPVDFAQSPINDAMYFTQMLQQMFQGVYGIRNPFGSDLPVRVYTHFYNAGNSFAVTTQRLSNGQIQFHNSIYLSLGDGIFLAAQAISANVLAFIITGQYSQLIFDGQSGGVSSSFADVTEMALNDYLRRLGFDWYWDGSNTRYTISANETANGRPFRYFYKPTLDNTADNCSLLADDNPLKHKKLRVCGSIDSADDFTEGLLPFWASGVFNRAFYVMSVIKNVGPRRAYLAWFEANRNYWMPDNDFVFAACGVIQSGQDRNLDFRSMYDAFKSVGVKCRTFSQHHEAA